MTSLLFRAQRGIQLTQIAKFNNSLQATHYFFNITYNNGIPDAHLIPIADKKFLYDDDSGRTMEFNLDTEGQVQSLTISSIQGVFIYNRKKTLFSFCLGLKQTSRVFWTRDKQNKTKQNIKIARPGPP